MSIDSKLRAYLLNRIDDFQSQERNEEEGDLPDEDVSDTLSDLSEAFRR